MRAWVNGQLLEDPSAPAVTVSDHGLTVGDGVFEAIKIVDSQPFAGPFLEAMGQVQDFWQEPAYAQLLQSMQKRLHDYVVADQGSAQEAMDLLIQDWTEIFEDEGKL